MIFNDFTFVDFYHIFHIFRVGNEIINGQDTQKWQLVTEIGQKTNKYTLWLKTETDVKNKNQVNLIPVR